jgi:hypothetical protein
MRVIFAHLQSDLKMERSSMSEPIILEVFTDYV